MEEKLVHILNEMAEYLSISQMKKLQEVLLKNLSEAEAHKTEVSNTEYLQMFLDAKKIEGCSERTLQYYRVTVEHLLCSISTPVRKMNTEEIRSYLSGYQQINGCGKVTVDNIRRNISSFWRLPKDLWKLKISPTKKSAKLRLKMLRIHIKNSNQSSLKIFRLNMTEILFSIIPHSLSTRAILSL